MISWLWDWGTTIIWGGGVMAVIHPIYQAILRNASKRGVKNISTAAAAIAATAVSLLWPFAIPFLVSHYMHTGRVFKASLDLVDAEESVANDKLVESSRRAALKQIEATSSALDRDVKEIEERSTRTRATEACKNMSASRLREAYMDARWSSVEEAVYLEHLQRVDSSMAHSAEMDKRFHRDY